MHDPNQYTGPAKELAKKYLELEGRIEDLESSGDSSSEGSESTSSEDSGPELQELELEELLARWPHSMDPGEYAARFEDAGSSDLARAIVAARSG